MWTVQGIGATEARPGHSRNEDIFLVDDAQGLYAVADGFGGHPAGEVASAAAVATAARALRAQRAATDPDALDLTGSLERAVQHACGEVYAMAAARPEWGGMCCSLTLALVVGEQAAVAHVGNSRLYLVRRGSLHRLTTDHTLPAALASSGAIPADEATAHPFSHVLTRSIGSHEAVLVDTLVFDLAPGDRLLLCTRGLANLLDAAPELVIEAVEDQDLDGLAQWLIDQANTREPEGDLSAVVIAAGPQDGDVEGTDTHRKLGALGAPFLFEALELPQLSQILAACTLEAYGPGEVVVATGAPLDRLLIGLDGRFVISRDAEELGALGAGGVAGAASLLVPRAARATLTAATPARLLAIRSEDYRTLVQRRPRLGALLMERLARRLSEEMELLRGGDGGAEPPNNWI